MTPIIFRLFPLTPIISTPIISDYFDYYLVQGTFTQDDLVNLAKQVDITAEGSVTVLYSKMGSDPNIRILDKTDAFEFLTSDDFQRALGQTKGVSLAQMKDPSFISPEKTALLNWNYDGTAGPWAGISKNFAEATVGDVRIMTSAPNMSGENNRGQGITGYSNYVPIM